MAADFVHLVSRSGNRCRSLPQGHVLLQGEMWSYVFCLSVLYFRLSSLYRY